VAREVGWWLWEHRYRGRLPRLRYYFGRLFGVPRPRSEVEALPLAYARAFAAQLGRREEILTRRAQTAARWVERLEGLPFVFPQFVRGHPLSRLYLRTPGSRWGFDPDPTRHPLAERLSAAGVESARPYRPLHLWPAYAGDAAAPLPKTELWVPELVSLPLHGELADRDLDRAAAAIRSFAS
jgi:perosamine synthetase